MTKSGKVFLGIAVAAALAIVVAVVLLANPLQKSDESLRGYLLQRVPLGSSLETLQAVAIREGWKFTGTSKSRPNGDSLGEHEVTMAWVVLGEYRSKEVDSHWVFNDRGLIDLKIARVDWKQVPVANPQEK